MPTIDEFRGRFDSGGQFCEQEGSLPVVFATKGGGRFQGTLNFRDGLCVRAAMDDGGEWVSENGSPIDAIRFLLDFGDEPLDAIVIERGRVIFLDEPKRTSSKRDFLLNLRVARNLFAHPPRVEADATATETETIAAALARAAIWLTPKSVAGFDPGDFSELGLERQGELLAAVRDFKAVAERVPSAKPGSSWCCRRW